MAPTTEETMTEAQPNEAPKEPAKEKKKKAGMKKKESDIDYDALEKQIATIKSNAAGSSAEKLLSQTLEELLALEKTYRLQADLKATSMCGVAVVQVRDRGHRLFRSLLPGGGLPALGDLALPAA